MPELSARDQEIMISTKTKESTYGGGVSPIDNTHYVGLAGFEATPDFSGDTVATDADEINGVELATRTDIISKRVKLAISMPRSRPHNIAMFFGLAGGAITSDRDGVANAYRHKITPITQGSDLPSAEVIYRKRTLQRAFLGIKAESAKMSCEAGGIVKTEAEWIGNGSRDADTSSFVGALIEQFIRAGDMKVFVEVSGDISIAATPVQGAQNISSATPEDITNQYKSHEFEHKNNLTQDPAAGGGYYLTDVSPAAVRTPSVKLSLTPRTDADIEFWNNLYSNQNTIALEFNCKNNTKIDAAGAFYYGSILVIPACRVIKRPWPAGGAKDTIKIDPEIQIIEDGTNPMWIIWAYNAQPAYFA